ncbi:MAG: ribosome biogenesis GTPase Der [Spartobacteria bacterium]|nr:ribosome biogenesis GTPase Der [Spartobacteria bacterium]
MKENQEASKRVIAIVGRPNVGKSALFNRIVRKRIAIVHEQSGVTRDRLCCETLWNDKRFELIDTGGVGMMDGSMTGNSIEDGTRRQVDLAIQDAAVVLFIVDITAGVTPLDEEVARLLHQSGKTVFLGANKADNEKTEEQAAEFESLGFPVVPVSALHNRGIGELLEPAIKKLPAIEKEATGVPLKVAVVGRPNAGKSSYINRLLRSDRVIVSEVPGTTRDSVEVPFVVGHGEQARHYTLIDTAGMRKSRKSPAVEKFSIIRAEKSIKEADVVVLVMDATEGPKSQDKKIASMIMEYNRGCFILVNKWDIAQEQGVTQRQYGKALREALPFLDFIPIIFASAQSGYNIRNTVEAIDYVSDQVQTTLTTGLLNRVIQEAVQRVAPPVVDGRRLKIYYATQIGVKPIAIRLFVNSPKRVKPAYKSYLVKSLRTAFGLEGAPVLLLFKAHSSKQ